MQNFLAIGWKMLEISAIENLCSQKVGQSSPKIFRGTYPLRPPIMPNFIEIGQTSLEIGVGQNKFPHTHTHTHTHTHKHTDRHTQTDRQTHGIMTGWVAPRSMREARLTNRNCEVGLRWRPMYSVNSWKWNAPTNRKCRHFCSVKCCMSEQIPQKTASFICGKFLNQNISNSNNLQMHGTSQQQKKLAG